MLKWLLLAAGVFLVVNSVGTRTYSYENPAKHCFNMDYIHVYGCFGDPFIPKAIAYGAPFVGGVLIFWAFYRRRQEVAHRGRREKA